MAAPIAPIGNIALPITSASAIPHVGTAEPGLFRAVLNQSIATVEQSRTNAQQSIDRFLSGEGEELHKVAMATQQAEMSFELFMQMRNKVVQAYQEIMRMQV